MGFFGKKKDDAPQEEAAAQPAEEAKAKHETEHVDESGNKKADVEVAGDVCEFC